MRLWLMTIGAAFTTFALIVLPKILDLGPSVVGAASDLGQMLAASVACAGCLVAAHRSRDHRRQAWRWLGIGTGAWALGEVVWSVYEIGLDVEVPFPSLADAGFLIFPFAAGWGLVQMLGAQEGQAIARGRDVMDGLVIAGSLITLSWVTALGSVLDGGTGDGWFAFVLSLGYPVGDVVLGTMALLALTRGGRHERVALTFLTVGLLSVSLADSAFVYLTSTSTYSSADVLTGACWILGFLLVGVGGCAVSSDVDLKAPRRGKRRAAVTGASATSRWQLALIYLPLGAAMVAVAGSLLGLRGAPMTPILLGGALVVMVLLRQFLAVLDNHRLLAALGEARDELQHRALHDALTGLPNRVLFADRLDQSLIHPEAEVWVMFCDLDDFKDVNDQLGHEAGDQLLQEIAIRLRGCVRDSDTVARLGGDEFAVLLDRSQDAGRVAQRMVASMARGVELDGRLVQTSVSVGIARHCAVAPVEPAEGTDRRHATQALSAEARAHLAAQLLREADSAMYVAKSRGKNQVAVAETSDPSGPWDEPAPRRDAAEPILA